MLLFDSRGGGGFAHSPVNLDGNGEIVNPGRMMRRRGSKNSLTHWLSLDSA